MLRRLVIALTALLSLLAAGVVATYLTLFAAGADRFAALVPANATAYATVYLQPSSGQQVNLAGLIGRLPGFADAASLDEKVDTIVHNLVANLGLDYRSDIKPWLGDQASVALVPDAAGTPHVVVLAAVRDLAAAESALARVLGEGAAPEMRTHGAGTIHVGARGTYTFVEEIVVISPTPEAVEAVLDTGAGEPSLAGTPALATASEALPRDHLAFAFAPVGLTDSDVGWAAAALIADADRLRLTATARIGGGGPNEPGEAREDRSSLAEWLSGDAIAAVELVGVEEILERLETATAGSAAGDQLSTALATARAAAALGLGFDLSSVLDADAAAALTAIQDGVPQGHAVLRPRQAGATEDALAALTELVAQTGGSTSATTVEGVEVTTLTGSGLPALSVTSSAGVAAIGTTVEAAAAPVLTSRSGSSLAATDEFDSAFEGLSSAPDARGYVAPGGLAALLGSFVSLPDDARDILAAIGALGMTVELHDDQIDVQAVLILPEDGAE